MIREQVDTAIRLKRFIPIPVSVFARNSWLVDPSRELIICGLSVVEDKSRTFDVCTGVGTGMGAWTFGKLFKDMAKGVDPAEMMESWLGLWLTDQNVNTFKVPARAAGMRKLILDNWPRGDDGRLDLAQAPMRLLAIVNQLDLRTNPVYGGGAGEARFVFGVVDRKDKDCKRDPPQFTIILEYGVPKSGSGCAAVGGWAKQWHNLGSIDVGTSKFNDALQNITDQFAGSRAILKRLRTNENALDNTWELREFHLDSGSREADRGSGRADAGYEVQFRAATC